MTSLSPTIVAVTSELTAKAIAHSPDLPAEHLTYTHTPAQSLPSAAHVHEDQCPQARPGERPAGRQEWGHRASAEDGAGESRAA